MNDESVSDAGGDFIRDIVAADLASGSIGRGDALSAGAQRIPASRPRQVDLPELRHRRGVRRPLQPALRRHQSHQGRTGIHRRDPARRALARLRLGIEPPLRIRLLRAALRLGAGSDPRRQGLCRRSVAGGNSPHPRHADRAGAEQPVPRPYSRGKPRSFHAHARRRISERRARAARQDRHDLGQHQPARSGALPHSPCASSAHGRCVDHLSELRLRARSVRRHRARHPFDLHAGIRRSPPALRLVHREPRCRRVRINTSSRVSM